MTPSLSDLCFHCHHWNDDHFHSLETSSGATTEAFKCKRCECVVVVNRGGSKTV